MDWKSLIPSLVEMTNSQYIAARENKRDHDLFNEGCKRDLDLFKESLKFNKESFLIDSKKELKQHEQQLIADYIHNLKESERDMFDQKNQQFQTIIVSASVMFAALSTVIIQGIIPSNSCSFLFIAYALTTALSFGYLFICIVICIEIISNASAFMFKKSKDEHKNLKKYFSQLNEQTNEYKDYEAEDVEKMNNEELQIFLSKHRNYIDKKLSKRDEFYEVYGLVKNNDDKKANTTFFSDYFDETLKPSGEIALSLFYGGTYNLLMAIIIFMFSKFYLSYNSETGAALSFALIGISVLIGVGIVWILPLKLSMWKRNRIGDEELTKSDGVEESTRPDTDTNDEGKSYIQFISRCIVTTYSIPIVISRYIIATFSIPIFVSRFTIAVSVPIAVAVTISSIILLSSTESPSSS